VVRRGKTFAAVLVAVTAVGLLSASVASATYHLMKIREVSSATGVADSSYVEIQMYFDFQNFLSNGAALVRCDATCSSPTAFSPFSDVANGHNQDTVLFADSGIGAGSKDFNVNLNLDSIQAGGAVCYLSEPGFADCVSWGNFSANNVLMTNYGTTSGTPAPALVSGMALRRSIAPGCSTLLEAGDDTNDSANDFSLTTPNPRSNSVSPTETACTSGGGGPTYPGSGPAPSSTSTPKKKCRKHKPSSGGGSTGGGAYSAKKHKCKKRR
jgi:hypothetical protein